MSDDYLVKNATMEQLAEAIRNVTGIESLLTPEQMIEVISVMQNVSADDKSIEIEDSTLQIKDFEKKYYKIEDNEETEVTGFAGDLRPTTVPDGQDGYKLQWIKDRRAQELDFYNTDADNEYPSVRAVLTDKLIEVVGNDGNLIPLDETTAFKNITGYALHQFASRKIQSPNLWELKTGLYVVNGEVHVTPDETLEQSFQRVVLISNITVLGSVCVYVAFIMPTVLVGVNSGITEILCAYDKTSTDPQDFNYTNMSVITSQFLDDEVSSSDDRVPTSLAVKNYVDNLISAINEGSY